MNPTGPTRAFRLETVGDYRQHFRGDAPALAALEQGCREAGIAPEV
jgi:hypothetical protein